MLDNETDDSTDQSYNDTAESGNETSALKAELETLKAQNSEMLNKFNTFMTSQNKNNEEKPLSDEEYKALLEINPKKALAYALDEQVSAKTAEIERRLSTAQQLEHYDRKTEEEFPLIKTDKAFQRLAGEEIKALISDGMDKNSPRLVYKATQIAALKYKGAQETKSNSAGGSGEAPTNFKGSSKPSKGEDKDFEIMAKMFHMSDKAKARAKEKIAEQANLSERRKNSRY